MNRYRIHEPQEPRMYLINHIYRGQRFRLKQVHVDDELKRCATFPREVEVRGYTPRPEGLTEKDDGPKPNGFHSYPHFVVRVLKSWRKKKLHACYFKDYEYYEPINE